MKSILSNDLSCPMDKQFDSRILFFSCPNWPWSTMGTKQKLYWFIFLFNAWYCIFIRNHYFAPCDCFPKCVLWGFRIQRIIIFDIFFCFFLQQRTFQVQNSLCFCYVDPMIYKLKSFYSRRQFRNKVLSIFHLND